MVLVRGWAGNRTDRDHSIAFLGERHQVVATDLGGHGESGLSRANWNLPAFGDDVVAVLDEVGRRTSLSSTIQWAVTPWSSRRAPPR